jgi:hypothetical protein
MVRARYSTHSDLVYLVTGSGYGGYKNGLSYLQSSVVDPQCLSPDPGSEFPSQIQGQKDSGSQIRIRIKEFLEFLTQKIVSKLSEI